MNPESLQDLISRAQNGEVQAMDDFLDLIRPYFEKVARGFVDPARASRSVSDLVQEAEIQVWNHLNNFKGGENEDDTQAMFRAWVSKIIRRLAIGHARRRNAQKRGDGKKVYSLDHLRGGSENIEDQPNEPAIHQTSASAKLFSRECEADVRAAINRLPDPGDREILVSVFFKDHSLRETAKIFGVNYSKVRDRYLRCVSALKKDLKHLD